MSGLLTPTHDSKVTGEPLGAFDVLLDAIDRALKVFADAGQSKSYDLLHET